MKFTRLHGNYADVNEIKSIGDEIVVDGVKHVIEEINTYHDEMADIHSVDYTLQAVVVQEPTIEELQQL